MTNANAMSGYTLGSDANPNPKYKLTDAAPQDYAKHEPKVRRVLLSIPTYNGELPTMQIIRSQNLVNPLGIALDLHTREGDSSIERARDVMFTEFLDNRPECSDFVFIDADIKWEPEGLLRLISHPVDFVGGAYRARCDNEVYVLRSLDNELQRDPQTGLMEVEGLATGFLRVTRRAAQKLADFQVALAAERVKRAAHLIAWLDEKPENEWPRDALKELVQADSARAQQYWYTDPTAPGMNIRHLFHFDVKDNRLHSEDYNFCTAWRALGEKCWLDPDQNLDHVGRKAFGGNLMRWLQGNAPKIPDGVPKGGAAAHFANPGAPETLLDVAKSLVGGAA